MDDLLESIKLSVQAGHTYPAFMSSICLPDICGYLDNPAEGSKKRYIDWFNNYMASYAGYMNGEEAYSLRCIVLHNGELSTTQYRSQSPKSTIVLDKFMLKSDGLHLIRLESNTVNGVLQPNLVVINTKKYCSDLIEAVKTWQTGSGKKLGEYDDTFRIGTGQSTIMDGAVSIG